MTYQKKQIENANYNTGIIEIVSLVTGRHRTVSGAWLKIKSRLTFKGEAALKKQASTAIYYCIINLFVIFLFPF